jgi:acyl-coenzyme A synthetase/AMP-(fatty) acid ligase
LVKLGVKKGDRVVGYMPNCIECLEVLLATASLGAIWSCSSPDFGATVSLKKNLFHQHSVLNLLCLSLF